MICLTSPTKKSSMIGQLLRSACLDVFAFDPFDVMALVSFATSPSFVNDGSGRHVEAIKNVDSFDHHGRFGEYDLNDQFGLGWQWQCTKPLYKETFKYATRSSHEINESFRRR